MDLVGVAAVVGGCHDGEGYLEEVRLPSNF
jgi:hypothetical protein